MATVLSGYRKTQGPVVYYSVFCRRSMRSLSPTVGSTLSFQLSILGEFSSLLQREGPGIFEEFFLVKWPAHELKKCVLYTRPQLDVAIKLSLVEIFAIPRSANRNVCQVISSLCNLWRGSICHKFTFQTSARKVQRKSKKKNEERKIM